MSIGTALKTLRKSAGYSQDQLADKLDVTRQAVSRWEKNLNDPPVKKLEEIASLFGLGVSALLEMSDTAEKLLRLTNVIDEAQALEKIKTITQLDLKGCCGSSGSMIQDTPQAKSIRVNESWFNKNLPYYKADDLKIITAEGDSMEPVIDDGDLVFIDISQDALTREGLFFLIYDGQYFIKRVQRLGGSRLLLLCDNPKYRDIEIEPGSQVLLKVVGRVVLSLKPQEFK